MKVEATPKFFKKTWPGEEAMELEVTTHWAQSGEPSDSLLMFLYKNPDRHSAGPRIRVRVTKAVAKEMGALLLKLASR